MTPTPPEIASNVGRVAGASVASPQPPGREPVPSGATGGLPASAPDAASTGGQAASGTRRPWGALLAVALGLALAGALPGCKKDTDAAILPANVAPVRPAESKVTLPAVKFVDVTEAAGIKFVHTNAATGEKLLPETMGSGVAVLDYDGDGDPDLFFVNSAPWPGQEKAGTPAPTQALYRNDGKGHFTDVTAEAGLALTFFGMGAAVGDYDNDGDPDLYVTGLGAGHLFRNDGKGHFQDVTAEAHAAGAGGWQTSAAWIDIENDGDLDLFVCQYVDWSPEIDRNQHTYLTGKDLGYDAPSAFKGSFCTLLRNDGGTFADVSESAGIKVRTPDLKEPMAKSLGVAPCDVDGDGLVDVSVANDTVQNFFFHNLGGGKFEEISIIQGLAFDRDGQTRGAMGIAWGDVRNDGSLALAVANFANEMMAFYVCDDPRAMQFSDQANLNGLGAPTQPPMKFGLFFFDYDLDGRMDLLSTNGHLESDIRRVQASQTYPQSAQLFWNTGKPGRSLFIPVGPAAAGPDLFRPIVGRGSAYADIDGDGDLDVVLTANGGPARLLRNDGGGVNHSIRLKLKGTTSNRDGIGARVVVKANGQEQHRQLFPAMGYLSSVELPLTFGLGSASKADSIFIVWPTPGKGGKVTELRDVPAGGEMAVQEPEDPR